MSVTTRFARSTWIGVASVSFLATACSSPSSTAPADGGPGDGGGCVLYESDADLTTPTVSFESDVLPIFEKNCGIGNTCHGGDPATAISLRGVFLGCVPDASASCKVTGDPGPQVYAGLVGPDASTPLEESCLPFVTVGSSTRSYLMNKVDDDLCAVPCCTTTNAAAAAVGETGCGSVMPYLEAVLPSAARDTIRRWIDQGTSAN
ncbi:MAG: hypothetical protein ACLP1X_14035 [Polyangiaceae bacterium]